MALRTRIALTFLLLLAAVLAVALTAVSAANRNNATLEVERQLDVGVSVLSRYLEGNRRLLAQGATAVAADYGFREAVAAHDVGTLVSALENDGARMGAQRVVLTTLDHRVIAAFGSQLAPDSVFEVAADGKTHLMVDGGKIYQWVGVNVKSPLPVARLVMGFELDAKAVREIADITDLGVTLSIGTQHGWSTVVSTVPRGVAAAHDIVRDIDLASLDRTVVRATLSRSATAATAPFARLTKTLYVIATVSLVCFAWAAFWIARNITRPLGELTQSVEKMRVGTYDGTFKLQRRDELGVLAEGLQLMQTAVRSRDQAIRRLAFEDALTGLMNRPAFSAALNEALAATQCGALGVAVFNLDRFRRINEHLGYTVGDAVLTRVGERLAAAGPTKSTVARLAADQFAAFTQLENPAQLPVWGTSLLMVLAEPVYVEAQPIDISTTIGLTVSAGDFSTADDLLRCADLALGRARREKRPLALYEHSLKPAARDQLSLLGELRHAIEHDELRLYFQPKIELATNRVAGAEVLVRWEHPTRGLLGPVAFVPFAEQTGFIRRLTRWILENAIACGARWHRAGLSIPLSVNISADDVCDPRLDARVAGLLTRHQLPPSLLTLELTESSFIADPERALHVLDALAKLGVHLSVDDFGTGYSSLSHLTRMPVDEIKIDRSFILGLERDAEFATVVRSAIDMGHGLGMKVVAEGIETESAALRLREFGCDVAQGYLYARPLPAEEFLRWLDGRARVPVVAVPVDFAVDDFGDTLSLATY